MDVGRITARLDAVLDDTAFDKFDRRLDSARRESRREVNARLDSKADTRGFDKFDRAMHGTTRSHGRFVGVLSKSGAAFRAVGTGLAAGGVGVAIFGKKVIDSASDINESLTKNQTLFGKYAAGIDRFAKQGAQSMGMSRSAVLEYTGVFGNLFSALGITEKKSAGMSTSLVKLAADMASFNNSTPEEALEAIRAGLVGETEPLRRFGVNMNDATLKAQALKMGLIKNTKEALTPQTKALAASALITKQTAKAHGDFAKTSGGLANQQRILKARISNVGAEIGGKLLPVALKAAKWLNGFITSLTHGGGKLGSFKKGVAGVVGPIAAFAKKLAEAIFGGGRFVGILKNIGSAVSGAVRFFTPLARKLGEVVVGIARFVSRVASSKAGLIAMNAAIGAIVGRLAAMAAVWAISKVIGFAKAIQFVVITLRAARAGTLALSSALKVSPLMLLATVIGGVAGALGLFSSGQDEAKTSARDLTDALQNEYDAMRALRDTDLDAASAKLNLRQANLAVESSERRVAQLRKAGKKGSLEYRQAEADLTGAKLQQKRATRDVGDTEADTTKKRRDAIRATQDAIQKTKDRIRTLGQDIIKGGLAGKSTKDLASKQRDLNNQMARMPSLKAKLDALRNGGVRARGGLDAARGGSNLLNAALGRLPRRVSIGVVLTGVSNFINDIARMTAAAFVPIRHKAQGGRVGPSKRGAQLFIAGEGGKDEWVISQEGNRQANIGWATEALETLTGKKVDFHRTGARRRKRAEDAPPPGYLGRQAFARVWNAARSVFPHAGARYPGQLKTEDTGFVFWAVDAGVNPIANDPKGEFWIPGGLLDALAHGRADRTGWGLGPNIIGKLLVHEMAHSQQEWKQTDSEWKAEGGAEAFARRFAGSILRRAGFKYRAPSNAGDPYNGFVNRVEKTLGSKWIERMQFEAKAQGGRVGPGVGGARLFVAGEGNKDEWVISQEGDRRKNVAWAIEALERLTGRKISLHRDGTGLTQSSKPVVPAKTTKLIKGAEGNIGSFERNIARMEHEYSIQERRYNLSEEDIVVQHDDGSVTIDAAKKQTRTNELTELKRLRGLIKDRYTSYQTSLATAKLAYGQAISKLARAVGKRGTKAALKKAYLKTLKKYQKRLKEINQLSPELDLEIQDQGVQSDEIDKEIGGLEGGGAKAAPKSDDPGDPGDPGEPGPTPAELAALVRAQVESFAEQRQALYQGFGSNFVRAGASGFVDPGAQAAGMQSFGSFGAVIPTAGTSGASVAGGGVTINNKFDAPPPSPLAWTAGVKFELGGIG